MAKTLVEQFVQTQDGMRSFQQERAIYEVTERIEDRMEEQGISRSELAQRLGKTKGWVTQLLDGEANKTIRTIADVFAVLGLELHFREEPIRIGKTELRPLTVVGEVNWPHDQGQREWKPLILRNPPSVRVG
jgi:transcriptional regulator with XRE-family HTH domain